jgi:hypothetical protein
MLNSIGMLLIHVGGWMFIVGGVIFLPIVRMITVPYYDNKLNLKNVYNPISEVYTFTKSFYKATFYGCLVVLHKGMKKSIERSVYGDMDFNEKARLIDKIICYPFFVLFCGGAAIILISAIFLVLQK